MTIGDLGCVEREAWVDEAGVGRIVIGVVALATGCSQPVVTLLRCQTGPGLPERSRVNPAREEWSFA